jgi:quinol---cytochrome c reductase iron-sulfur subunit, bacillus type
MLDLGGGPSTKLGAMSDDPHETESEAEGAKPSQAPSPAATDVGRRGAMRTLAVVGGCVYTGALAVPALGLMGSTPAPPEGAASSDGSWYRVHQLERLEEGVVVRAKISGDERDAFTVSKNQTIGSVWLIKKGDAIIALSAECPHLGCAIDANADGKSFHCPCHTSNFSMDGKAEAGPSPRPMDELSTRVTDGWVEVEFKRFRQGMAEKVEA